MKNQYSRVMIPAKNKGVRRNDIFYPLQNISARGNGQLLHTRILHHKPHHQKKPIAFFHIRTFRPLRWHAYCLLDFCNEPRHARFADHWTAVQQWTARQQRRQRRQRQLVKDPWWRYYKKGHCLFCTHPRSLHVKHIVFTRATLQRNYMTMFCTFVCVGEVKKPPHYAFISTLKR